MIEVKMYLYDADEIALMAQFESILTQKRAMQTPPVQPGVGLTVAGAESQPGEPGGITGLVVVNSPVASEVVDDVTMQRTITAYGQKHGVSATIARMQELFGVSKASQVPAERRAEFVAAFQV